MTLIVIATVIGTVSLRPVPPKTPASDTMVPPWFP